MIFVELHNAGDASITYHVNIGSITYMYEKPNNEGTCLAINSSEILVKETPAEIAQKMAAIVAREHARRTIIG